MIRLSAQNLTLAYDDNQVIHDLSLEIPAEQITALIGPNGSGKSTLLRGLARLMHPQFGAAYLDGQAIHTQPTKQVARHLAMLPQRATAPGGLTVESLVAYGRFPYQGFLGGLSALDEAHVDSAMEDAGITHLRGSCLAELSGGQRQLAWIAMALAQDTPLLLLDEPTTFLDLAHQLEILDTLEKLQQQRQRTIVLVLHDINQAARYASHMVALVDGRIAASGTPEEMMTAENLARVFNIEALVMKRNDDVAVPYCIPISKRS